MGLRAPQKENYDIIAQFLCIIRGTIIVPIVGLYQTTMTAEATLVLVRTIGLTGRREALPEPVYILYLYYTIYRVFDCYCK